MSLTSPTTKDAAGFVSHPLSKTLTGLNVPNDSFFYLRWSGSDAVTTSSSSRDEFALDSITLQNFTFAGGATPLLGDVNQDGTVDVADVQSLMAALADMSAYRSAHSALSVEQVSQVLDVDQNGLVNNADAQSLISDLAAGTLGQSQLGVVPEPGSYILLLVGVLSLWLKRAAFGSIPLKSLAKECRGLFHMRREPMPR